MLAKVEDDIAHLLTPHINSQKEALIPALTKLNWSSYESHLYFLEMTKTINNFEVLVDR